MERCIQCFSVGGNLKERDHFENLEVDGMIILNMIFKKCDGDMD